MLLYTRGGCVALSVADEVYRHIEGQNIEKIDVDYGANLVHILTQYMYKSSNKVFENRLNQEKAKIISEKLQPYFNKEVEKKEKKVGTIFKYWTNEEKENFRLFFMEKYKDLIKTYESKIKW